MSQIESIRQSEHEAARIAGAVRRDAPGLDFSLERIGNGEQVVKITKGPLYIWSEEDWEKKKNESDIIVKRLIA